MLVTKAERLNTYQKRIAMQEASTPCIRYTGKFKATNEAAERFFNPYEAPPAKRTKLQEQVFQANPDALKINEENRKKFDRTEHLQIPFILHYQCEHETEEERLEEAKRHILHRMYQQYKGEKITLDDFELTITKEVL
ncbi:hypothetical protein CSV77_03605 [Sporosarcina sp. P16b]|uniref:hypothetical protein n=1 Tax=Sporosarcina sp. P16b TaxID=2048261 RepID=UPI000C164691|nr:hypothetical protein [Sporosarcina sp. P16b]PIC71137.1 hypothetical protein CSV77_03605 [Sporosarcina sp. P16b]